jgi:hypothetical protein
MHVFLAAFSAPDRGAANPVRHRSALPLQRSRSSALRLAAFARALIVRREKQARRKKQSE